MAPTFVDITAESGLVFSNFTPDFRGGAVAVADLDGDGFFDVVTADRLGGFAVFGNLGATSDTIRFAERTADTGIDLSGSFGGVVDAVAAGDLDNDGDSDLLLAATGISATLQVYANDGTGRFSLASTVPSSDSVEHLLLVDIDDNGWLDVHSSNSFFSAFGDSANRLYLQRAPLSFERVAFPAGQASAASWAATAFDADADGDRDIYVANDTLAADFGFQVTDIDTERAVDQLLRNDGLDPDGVPVFTDIAAQVGLDAPRSSMGGLVGDFDGDGLLDLFSPDFGGNELYLRPAFPAFTDVAAEYGVRASHRSDLECHPGSADDRCLLLSWGSAYRDFDGDGARELLVVNGPSRFSDPPPPQLYFWPNRQGRGFTELAPLIGCAEGHGLVPADLDRDGDLDVVVSVREGLYRVYENRAGPPTHWLGVRLRGTISNREGRGAVVTVHLPDGRTMIEVIGAGGVAFSSVPAELFISTGGARPTELTVTWPSGHVDRVTDVPDHQVITIAEGAF